MRTSQLSNKPIKNMTTTETETTKPRNPYRIPFLATLKMHGLALEDCDDSIVPACCIEGCEVEPDGCCEHGCPSILLAAGII